MNVGKVVQVIGPTVDVAFDPENLPKLYNAIIIEDAARGIRLTVEAALHVGVCLDARLGIVPNRFDDRAGRGCSILQVRSSRDGQVADRGRFFSARPSRATDEKPHADDGFQNENA